MLSSKYRIAKADIVGVVKRGYNKSAEGFYVKYILDEKLPNNLYSFSISTKVSKSATVRNRIKRIFRAAVYELDKAGSLKRGSYSFVIKSAELKDLKSNEIQKRIMQLFL